MANDPPERGPTPVINDEVVWDLSVARDGATVFLRARGELDLDSAPRLLAEVRRQLDDGVDTLEIELSGLAFVDSSGLGTLVACWRRAQAAGVEFRLLDPTEDVTMTLHITGLDQILPIVRS
jgi:anti-sigma B factor antagonist